MRLGKSVPILAVALLAIPCGSLLAADVSAVLVAPQRVFSGGTSSVTITTLDPRTHVGVPATVRIDLVDASGTHIAPIWWGTTGALGHVTTPFTVPALPAGTGKIVAKVGSDRLEAEVVIDAAPAILIETDKPIYKPGQRIRGRVLLLSNDLAPVEGDVEVVIRDGKGIKLDRQPLRTNAFGVAPFELPIAREANFGVWKIAAASGGATGEIDLRVEPYVLPRFRVEADLERTWFLADERIEGTIRARYFFGKPVAGRARVLARRYVGEWEDYDAFDGPLGPDGEAPFSIDPVEFVAGTAGASGDGSVLLEIAVEDESGHEETTTQLLRIPPAPVKVELIAASATVTPDLRFEILVVTETPEGEPVERTLTVRASYDASDGSSSGEDQEVTTEGGMARATFMAPPDVVRATVTAEIVEQGYRAKGYVELRAAYSPSSSFLHLSRLGTGPAQVGDVEVLRAYSTFKGTTFCDVVAGGRTVYTQALDGDEIWIPVTAQMAPRARVIAYRINPDSEVSADSIAFDVEVPVSVSLSAGFGADRVAPGDPVKVTVRGPGPAMVGLSIVDESIYALAEGRLTMAGVFEELERRFMEPQIEVHPPDGGGGVPGPMPPWEGEWGGFRTRGAADAIAEAGLQIATTEDLSVPVGVQRGWRGEEDWFLFDLAGGIPPAPAPEGDPDGRGLDDGLAEVERVRQFFPETWVWEPMLLLDESGEAELELEAPDSITSWRLHAVATSQGGGIGIAEAGLEVFQSFFAEPDLPYAVTRGEEVPLRIQIFNYLDTPQTVRVELEGGDWFELVDPGATTVSVEAGSVLAASFRIRPTVIGRHEVHVIAQSPLRADAVVREIHVEAEGVPAEIVANGRIEADERATLDLSYPPGIVPGSETTVLAITPSLMGPTLEGLDDLLGMPYGCGEQNMIFFAPDVQVLRYLKATGNLTPETRAEAEYFINVGYQRELTYRRADGSFSAFGDMDEEGSLWLTAFVLGVFADARDVKEIDEGVLADAAGWIAAHQNGDGSWSPVGFVHHKEMIGGVGTDYTLTAYVAGSLAAYGADPSGALARARDYLASHRTEVLDDAYALAVAAWALGRIPGAEGEADATIAPLLELAIEDASGLHWEPHAIETTSYAALALMARERLEAGPALEWIAVQRNALGGYGTTQDTVMAIRALVEAAVGESRDLDLTLTVLRDGEEYARLSADASSFDLMQTLVLPAGGTVDLVAEGRGSVGYQVAKRFHVPGELAPPPKDMALEVDYASDHVEVDEIVDVTVRVAYTGPFEKSGMAIVDVGIPTGFAAIRDSLGALVDEGTLKRYELAGRKAILYVEALVRGEPLEFSFQVRALFPVRAAPVPSKAYDYYDPDTQATDPGGTVVIIPRGEGGFVRGDANRDGALDLADAIVILEYLFSGEEVSCVDALDTNDDGAVDLSDAIRLLSFLFVSGPPPAAPYPEAGQDASADGLGCGTTGG